MRAGLEMTDLPHTAAWLVQGDVFPASWCASRFGLLWAVTSYLTKLKCSCNRVPHPSILIAQAVGEMKANLRARPSGDLMLSSSTAGCSSMGAFPSSSQKPLHPYQLGTYSWLLSSHPWAQRELISELGSRDINIQWSSLHPWALSTLVLTYGYQHCKPHANCACDLSLCCFMEILLLSVFCLGNVRQNI